MIIEFLLLADEALGNAQHLSWCDDKECEDIAHLYDRVADRYTGLAEVFAFVAGSTRGHAYRLTLARERADREDSRRQQQHGLAVIREAWDAAERGHADPSA